VPSHDFLGHDKRLDLHAMAVMVGPFAYLDSDQFKNGAEQLDLLGEAQTLDDLLAVTTYDPVGGYRTIDRSDFQITNIQDGVLEPSDSTAGHNRAVVAVELA
jgi:hypothetical protein